MESTRHGRLRVNLAQRKIGERQNSNWDLLLRQVVRTTSVC